MVAGEDRVCTIPPAGLRGSVSLRNHRYAPGSSSGTVNVGIHQTEFQRRGRAEFLSHEAITGCPATQPQYGLRPDAVRQAPATPSWLTVTQNINVLLNGVFTRFAQARIGHYRAKLIAALAAEITGVTMTRRPDERRLITRFAVTERDAQPIIIFFTNGGIRNAFFTADRCAGYRYFVLGLPNAVSISHFHQEVNAAAQIKTELHRIGVNIPPTSAA